VSDKFKSFAWMTALALASAALFWLLRDHWGHALGIAPYLLFLACPVMHLFMDHGHNHGNHHNGHARHTSDHPSS
jgi:hypothetical protein